MFKMNRGCLGVVCAILLASCGGEGGNSDADVTVYGACGNTPNYLADVDATRWKKFPLTVGLDLSAAPGFSDPNLASIYLRATQAGASGWNVGNGIGAVGFVVGRDADIIIEFDGGTTSTGNLRAITVAATYSGYQGRSVRISMSSGYYREILALVPRDVFEANIRETVQHEMGHALFARGGGTSQGHARSSGNVMSNGGNGGTLSQADINTIREAYCKKL